MESGQREGAREFQASCQLLNTIENIHTCYGLRGRKEKFKMAVLTAYFDESGVHGADSCVVAGFVGNDAQWQAMAAEWIPAIKPRQNLHMRKLKWNRYPARITSLLSELGPIPHKYNLKGIAAGIKWADFNAVIRGKVTSRFANAYRMCAFCAISVVLMEVAGDDEVFFLFDRQEGTRKEDMERMRDIVYGRLGADRRVKGIDFIRRDSTVCLDPADYLAYVVREQSIDPNSFKSRAGASIIGRGGNGGWMSREQLQEMVADWADEKRTIQQRLAEFSAHPYFRGIQ
jgi:hypothetical protein